MGLGVGVGVRVGVEVTVRVGVGLGWLADLVPHARACGGEAGRRARRLHVVAGLLEGEGEVRAVAAVARRLQLIARLAHWRGGRALTWLGVGPGVELGVGLRGGLGVGLGGGLGLGLRAGLGFGLECEPSPVSKVAAGHVATGHTPGPRSSM